MAEPNAEVVRRAQAGDEAALIELVTGQERYVYSIALRMMGNPADAADVTQETFMRLLKSLPTYRAETKLTTWLYRIVVNLAIDAIRRRGRPIASLDDVQQDTSEIDVADLDLRGDPAVMLDRAETAVRIEEGLALLTPIQRAALTMCYVEDLTYEEIADVLQMPLNTVKSHIRRAKLRMAQLLAEPSAEAPCQLDGGVE